MGFVVKGLVAAGGTVAIGRALMAVYEHDVDYTPVNDLMGKIVSGARSVVSGVAGTGADASDIDTDWNPEVA